MKSYFGGKSASGSFHQIMNEVPPIGKFISGFLGNCPMYRYMSQQIDSIGIELDDRTIAEYWQDWQYGSIMNDSWFDWLDINYSSLDSDTLIYLDPPYLMDTRKSKSSRYRFELTDSQHIDLLDGIRGCQAKVIISGYQSELYNDYLADWRIKEWRVGTRKGAATETIWMNYDEPEELFTYDFLGTNKTDRQRIKRKLERFDSKLKELDTLERKAILSMLKGRYK